MSADWIEADDDTKVARLAREHVPEGLAEIWERDRLVARLKPGDKPIDIQD